MSYFRSRLRSKIRRQIILEASQEEQWWINWEKTQGTPEGKRKLIQRVKKKVLPDMKERDPPPRAYEMQLALKMRKALKDAGEDKLAEKVKQDVAAAAKARHPKATIADIVTDPPFKRLQKIKDDPSRRNPMAAAKAAQLKGPRDLEDAPDSVAAQKEKEMRAKKSKYDFLDDEEEFEIAGLDGAEDKKEPKSGDQLAKSKSKQPGKSVPIGKIIKNRTQGDMFRMWVNATHEAYAKKADLDEEGSHTNKYIAAAWDKFGKEFMASDNYKMVQVGDKKIPFSKLGTKGLTGNEGDGAIKVKGKPISEGYASARWRKLAGI